MTVHGMIITIITSRVRRSDSPIPPDVEERRSAAEARVANGLPAEKVVQPPPAKHHSRCVPGLWHSSMYIAQLSHTPRRQRRAPCHLRIF